MSSAGAQSVTVAEDAAALTRAAADLVVQASSTAGGRGFTIALSGGSTPRRLYDLLASPEFRDRIDWGRWRVFWGDERLVPPDHADSNYALAEQLLLSRVPIPRNQVFRAPVEAGGPDEVARAYEATLRSDFGEAAGAWPAFDLILLGMGSDGHTASLFPGKPALDENTRWVVSSTPGVLPPPVDRVTFTFPVLNAARSVAFLVGGKDKTQALREVLGGSSDLPAARVQPAGGVRWLIDRDAHGE